MTGSAARLNPFRWSTKFTDEESALVYYGRRFYSPMLGRWVNRDPIQERGGRNLYAFVKNHSVGAIDFLGNEGNWITDDIRIDPDPVRGAHVHDYGNNVAYGFGTDQNGDLTLTSLKGHADEFDVGRAQKSLQGVLQTQEGYQALKSANASLWNRVGTKAGQLTRNTVQAVGSAIKAAGKAAGVAAGMLAIVQAASASEQIGNALNDYSRHASSGEGDWMELDALEIAIGVQDMTGNYFVTMEVLGILSP